MFLWCLHRQQKIQWRLWKQNVCEWLETYKAKYKRKISVAMFEEMKSEETTISSDGDRVSDLVREGNIWITF